MSESNSPSQSPRGITVQQPIRWGDMDALGHVNNIVYFQYCESARMAYFEAMDLERFKRQPTDGPAIVTANLNFRRQMHYPGKVLATASVTKLSKRSFTLSYTLRDAENHDVVADGDSVCVWLDYAAGKSIPLPEAMVDTFVEIEKTDELRPA